MVIRQTKYKDKNFFSFRLNWLENTAIPKLKNILSTGLDERRTKITLNSIAQFYFELTIVRYSSGFDIDFISREFSKCIDSYLKSIEVNHDLCPDRLLEQYIESIWLLSFCYYFNVSKSNFKRIYDRIPFSGEDMLIDRIIATICPNHPISVGKLAFPDVYSSLAEALNSNQARETEGVQNSVSAKNHSAM